MPTINSILVRQHKTTQEAQCKATPRGIACISTISLEPTWPDGVHKPLTWCHCVATVPIADGSHKFWPVMDLRRASGLDSDSECYRRLILRLQATAGRLRLTRKWSMPIGSRQRSPWHPLLQHAPTGPRKWAPGAPISSAGCV